MWLTGVNVPFINITYVDKHMKDYTLMHAIARVNRVYPSKEVEEAVTTVIKQIELMSADII